MCKGNDVADAIRTGWLSAADNRWQDSFREARDIWERMWNEERMWPKEMGCSPTILESNRLT
jgi:hypothetical protein